MALRRGYQGYGSARPMRMPGGTNRMPLPPPPDGQPPVRLPIGEGDPNENEPDGDPDDPLTVLKKKMMLGQM